MIGFESIPTEKLEALSSLLRSSGQFPPRAKLERVLGEGWATKADFALTAALQEGWSAPVAAAVLDGICSDRKARVGNLEWVVSGPSQDGVPTRSTGSVFRSMIHDAQSEVFLSSYSLANGPELLAALHGKMTSDRSFRVRMVLDLLRPYRDSSTHEALRTRFADDFRHKHWPWETLPEVYYYPRTLLPDPSERGVLHAKCVIIDRSVALVTSANLSKAAQERNIEAGIRIKDPDLATNLLDFFESLIQSKTLVKLDFLTT